MNEPPAAEFDTYAGDYDEALMAGLRLTGEPKEYFAERRIRWFRDQVIAAGGHHITQVVDFGCGDGDAAPLLRRAFESEGVTGVDTSPRMIHLARARHPWATFRQVTELSTLGPFDAAYCNGVLHHIPPSDRVGSLRALFDSLRPGGFFGMWENHPWNPGTRVVMARVSFDKNAVLLSPPEARRLLREVGFEVVRTDHLFIFPRWLRGLRPIEEMVSRLPIGGQYQVLARRPL